MKKNIKRALVFVLSCVFSMSLVPVSATASNRHVHSFTEIVGTIQIEHPHEFTLRCSCGATKVSAQLDNMCSTCRNGELTASNSVTERFVFFYLDGDQGMGVPVPAPVDCTVSYSNQHKFPISMLYDYPPFVSFNSRVAVSATISPIFPSVFCLALAEVDYYSSSGSLIVTQDMQWDQNNHAIPDPLVTYPLFSTPSYTISQGGFMMQSTGQSENIVVTTYF